MTQPNFDSTIQSLKCPTCKGLMLALNPHDGHCECGNLAYTHIDFINLSTISWNSKNLSWYIDFNMDKNQPFVRFAARNKSKMLLTLDFIPDFIHLPKSKQLQKIKEYLVFQ